MDWAVGDRCITGKGITTRDINGNLHLIPAGTIGTVLEVHENFKLIIRFDNVDRHLIVRSEPLYPYED